MRQQDFDQLAEAVRLGAQAAVGPGDVVVVTDPDFRVIAWDQAATELYGWTADEAVGRILTDVVPRAGTVGEMRAASCGWRAKGCGRAVPGTSAAMAESSSSTPWSER